MKTRRTSQSVQGLILLVFAVVLGVILAMAPGPVQATTCDQLSDCVIIGIDGGPLLTIPILEPQEGALVPVGPPLPGVGAGAVAFLEPAFEACPGTPTIPQGCLSDILVFLNGQLFFVSDDNVTTLEGILLGLTVPISFVTETGGPQDVTGALNIDALGHTILVEVQSDVVPEPSTWILLGSGLVGLVAWRKFPTSRKTRPCFGN